MIMEGWFLSRSSMRMPRSTMACIHSGLFAGTTRLLFSAGSKPWVSTLASSTRYSPYWLQSSYLPATGKDVSH